MLVLQRNLHLGESALPAAGHGAVAPLYAEANILPKPLTIDVGSRCWCLPNVHADGTIRVQIEEPQPLPAPIRLKWSGWCILKDDLEGFLPYAVSSRAVFVRKSFPPFCKHRQMWGLPVLALLRFLSWGLVSASTGARVSLPLRGELEGL